MANRGRGRERSLERGGRKRERDESRDRDHFYSRTEEEILSVLNNIRPLPHKTIDEIHAFANKIDAMRIPDSGKGETKDLFVGNLVAEDISTQTLRLLLNTAMQMLGLVGKDEEPVLNCRMNNKYCFIEFRSTKDCSLAINLTGIPFKDCPLKMGRPAKFSGPTDSMYSWDDLVDIICTSTPAPIVNTPPLPLTKLYREIFVGNTNDRMTEVGMKELLGGAMMKMGLSHSHNENPIHQVKMNGKFAFIEMRTCVDAANVLNLAGIPYCGGMLNLVRTKKYDGGCGVEAYFRWDELYRMWVEGDLRLMTAGVPTRVLAVTNITTQEALTADPALYMDIIEDTRAECSQCGVVKSVIVPRNAPVSSGGRSPVGKVFIEMESVNQAIDALMLLKGRSFEGRIVDVKFYPEDAYRSMDYIMEPAPVIITASYGVTSMDKIFSPGALHKIAGEENLISGFP